MEFWWVNQDGTIIEWLYFEINSYVYWAYIAKFYFFHI